jgi:hypothetical protein
MNGPVNTSITLPRDLRDEWYRAATQSGVLMSQWLRAAIREKLERDRNER